MIPFRDVIPSRTTPVVTITIIAVNAASFAGALWLDDDLPAAAVSWAVLTSMFLHASALHAGVNMLYLWLFGGNVEDRMGHGRFLAFYLLCGAAGALAHTVVLPGSRIPLAGGTGAIAGILGAYYVLYPSSRILTLAPLVLTIHIVEVPAIVFLGVWVVLQFATGLGPPAGAAAAPPGLATVAASIAGFMTGAAGVILFRRPERQRVEWWHAP